MVISVKPRLHTHLTPWRVYQLAPPERPSHCYEESSQRSERFTRAANRHSLIALYKTRDKLQDGARCRRLTRAKEPASRLPYDVSEAVCVCDVRGLSKNCNQEVGSSNQELWSRDDVTLPLRGATRCRQGLRCWMRARDQTRVCQRDGSLWLCQKQIRKDDCQQAERVDFRKIERHKWTSHARHQAGRNNDQIWNICVIK